MTFPTADMRLRDIALGFFTIGRDLNTALKACGERPANGRFQFKKLTGIGARNTGHRAGLAQITCPALSRCLEQAAFLNIATAKVISIEVRAFSACRGSHFCIIDLETK